MASGKQWQQWSEPRFHHLHCAEGLLPPDRGGPAAGPGHPSTNRRTTEVSGHSLAVGDQSTTQAVYMPVLDHHIFKLPHGWDTYWCAQENRAYYRNTITATSH